MPDSPPSIVVIAGPNGAAMAAGRIMLARLRELAAARETFAFETTLASRSFAPWIGGLVATGYEFHSLFLWVPTPEFAVRRVGGRVRAPSRPGSGGPTAILSGIEELFFVICSAGGELARV